MTDEWLRKYSNFVPQSVIICGHFFLDLLSTLKDALSLSQETFSRLANVYSTVRLWYSTFWRCHWIGLVKLANSNLLKLTEPQRSGGGGEQPLTHTSNGFLDRKSLFRSSSFLALFSLNLEWQWINANNAQQWPQSFFHETVRSTVLLNGSFINISQHLTFKKLPLFQFHQLFWCISAALKLEANGHNIKRKQSPTEKETPNLVGRKSIYMLTSYMGRNFSSSCFPSIETSKLLIYGCALWVIR